MDLDDLVMIFRRRWRITLGGSLLAFLLGAFFIPSIEGKFTVEGRILCTSPVPGNSENIKAFGLLGNLTVENMVPLLNSGDLGTRLDARLRKEGTTHPASGPALVSRLEIKKGDTPNVYKVTLGGPDPQQLTCALKTLLEEGALLWRERIAAETGSAEAALSQWKDDLRDVEFVARDRLDGLRRSIGLSGPDLGYELAVQDVRDIIHQRRQRVEELSALERQSQEELKILEEGKIFAVTPENIDSVLGQLPVMAWFREMNEKIVKDEVKLLGALRTKTDLHPDVRALRSEVEEDKRLLGAVFEDGHVLNQYLERVKRYVEGEAERRILAKKVQLGTYVRLGQDLRDSIADEEKRFDGLRDHREEYQDLFRSLQAREKSRSRMGDAAAEIQIIASAGKGPPISLQSLSSAERKGRGPLQLYSLAALLSMLVGAGLMVVRESTDSRLRSSRDLVRRHGMAPLAVIPWSAARPLAMDRARDRIAPRAPQGALGQDALSFDGMARTLVARGEGPQTILVAGAEKGAGRSYVAAGLARAAARLGYRVTVLDADGKSPALHRYLVTGSRLGLGDLLAADAGPRRRVWELAGRARSAGEFPEFWGPSGVSFQGLPEPVGMAGLPGLGEGIRVILAGSPRADFSRLLQSQRMTALLEELSASNDLVLIDSAALSACGDALSLATRVDGVVLVARAGRTSSGMLDWAIHSLEGVGANILGVVLNKAKPEPFAPSAAGSAKGRAGHHARAMA